MNRNEPNRTVLQCSSNPLGARGGAWVEFRWHRVLDSLRRILRRFTVHNYCNNNLNHTGAIGVRTVQTLTLKGHAR
eukprot:5956395-Alexandrium_andersonii.AAC.1